jgi:methionyl-tRNA formyltransferase
VPTPSTFEIVFLLTGSVEAAALAYALRVHNPRLDIRHVASLGEIEALDRADLVRARLIGFSTDIIVPPCILDALGFDAYNFHPGPPQYPGWGQAHFAVYDQATVFGVTAHRMAERVDTGPIVGVETFAIPSGTGASTLERLTYVALVRLFWKLAAALTQAEPLAALPISWGARKCTRRQFNDLQKVTPNISKDELDRRVLAFGDDNSAAPLTVSLHGYRFCYLGPEMQTRAEAPAHDLVAANARQA